MPKPDKDIPRKENNRPIFLLNIGTKIFNRLLADQMYKMDYTPWPSEIDPRKGEMVQHMKIDQCYTLY